MRVCGAKFLGRRRPDAYAAFVRSQLGLVLCAIAVGSATSLAHADDKASCIAASENAQKLRGDQHLLAARDAFKLCARDTCPAVVRKDCDENFEALDKKLIPTIVLRARNAAGEDVVTASVKVDEQPTPLDGNPVSVDPGRHKIRVITDDESKVVDILAVQGERNRVVVVTFDGKPTPTNNPTVSATVAPAAPSSSTGSVVQRVVGLSMIGLGVVSLGVGVVFLMQAVGESGKFNNEGAGLKTCTSDANGNPTSVNANYPQPCHTTDSSGLTFADRSNRFYVTMGVFGAVGLTFAVVGTILVATSFGSKSKASATMVRPYPIVGDRLGGLGFVGTF
jgi:hypothetical protein